MATHICPSVAGDGRAKHEKGLSMSELNAAASGTFKIGGQTKINRLGFGAMRITGPGIWGEPTDRAEAIRTLKRLPELGVDFIDTANSYGPDVSERLIREALHPYGGILVATKAGLTRGGPDRWTTKGDPDHLIAEARKSQQKLGVEQIGFGSFTASTPKCLAASSSPPSSRCLTTAPSSMPA